MYPQRITFVTNPRLCNLACQPCFRVQAPLDWVEKDEMDFAVVRRVVEAFAPLGLREIIPSTSGEPLLYAHFAEFLDLAFAHNIKVNVTTNGTFPGGGVEFWAPRLWPVLSDIKISVMGFSAPVNEALMTGISHDQQRANILALLRLREVYLSAHPGVARPTVSLQFTLCDQNRAELPALRQWAAQVGIDRVKVNPLWRLGTTGRTDFPRGACPFLGREAWVWVDGSFQVCPNPDARYTLRSPSPLGDFGNFATDDPVALWQGARYRKFCKDFPGNALCERCGMKVEN
jgi:MoaA/NifB/PqqE/SkfB family radical SAM enzyme